MSDAPVSGAHSVGKNHGPLVVVVGPTAVGKTAISLQLAQDFDGEIVSADSRQIYRGLDIGTDKVDAAQRALVPHRLLDVVDPDEVFTLAQYQRAANAAIEDIHSRNKLPLLVGGTGLYVRAVTEGLGIPEVPPQSDLRAALEEKATEQGVEALHAWLRKLDPLAADRIDARNVRRVMRALEVCLVSGQPISTLQQAQPPPYRILRIGLTRSREALYQRIDQRVEAMLAAGLVDEVRGLLDAGLAPTLPALTGLGYRQIIQYLAGECTMEEAVASIKRETRRLVRQQGTWFRLDDERIQWFNLEQVGYREIAKAAGDWLQRCPPASPVGIAS